jgi:hypothetical protein
LKVEISNIYSWIYFIFISKGCHTISSLTFNPHIVSDDNLEELYVEGEYTQRCTLFHTYLNHESCMVRFCWKDFVQPSLVLQNLAFEKWTFELLLPIINNFILKIHYPLNILTFWFSIFFSKSSLLDQCCHIIILSKLFIKMDIKYKGLLSSYSDIKHCDRVFVINQKFHVLWQIKIYSWNSYNMIILYKIFFCWIFSYLNHFNLIALPTIDSSLLQNEYHDITS